MNPTISFLRPLRPSALAAVLALAACGSPPVVAPPPAPTIPAPPVSPGSAVPAASGTHVWTDKLAGSAQRLRAALQGAGVAVSQTSDQRLWVSMPADAAFAPGRAALKPPATGWLDQVAAVLRESPRAEAQIVSDADGAGESSRALALDRAASARDWLVARGVLSQRVAIAGRNARGAPPSDGRKLDLLIGERGPAEGAK